MQVGRDPAAELAGAPKPPKPPAAGAAAGAPKRPPPDDLTPEDPATKHANSAEARLLFWKKDDDLIKSSHLYQAATRLHFIFDRMSPNI